MLVSYSSPSVRVWSDIGEKQHCVSYLPPSVAEKKKQQSSVIEKSTISLMALLNLHKFSSIDLRFSPLPLKLIYHYQARKRSVLAESSAEYENPSLAKLN